MLNTKKVLWKEIKLKSSKLPNVNEVKKIKIFPLVRIIISVILDVHKYGLERLENLILKGKKRKGNTASEIFKEFLS